MREPKSLLLALLSICLVATWVYHLYDKSLYSDRLIEKVPVRDSLAIAHAIQDSLQQIYSESLAELDSTRNTADSIKDKLSVRVIELNRLKAAINGIIKNRYATQKDLERARNHINQMKTLMGEMSNENIGLEVEKTRLQATLDQLSGEMVTLQSSIDKLGKENKELSHMVNMASTFILSDMKFNVVDVRKNNKEIATDQVSKADKMIISFMVKNNILRLPSADVYMVVTNPVGRVIQNSIWNSGNFITPKGETIAYTIRDHFDYEKGDLKKIIYTITPDNFFAGDYHLKVFHNGVIIGDAIQKLQ
ncbi:MAG: hypothetical protein H0V30_07230 [Chitinophagaceae bacterium]|nr:hypothetical protein [Chitinophagaceae bacterium]